jgi:hypothetical protein
LIVYECRLEAPVARQRAAPSGRVAEPISVMSETSQMKPWSKAWIIHRTKVAVLVLIVFIMPVILFAMSEG